MVIVGLTGNFGMGKSYVLSVFRNLGAVTLDSDRIVEILLNEDKVIAQIKALLGPEVVTADNTLDKKAVAARIFSNPEARKGLEALLHPMVFERVEDFILRMKQKDRIVIVEVPLLFEGGYQGQFDKTVTVFASEETAIERLVNSGFSLVDAKARLTSQLPIEIKKERADFVIDNSGPKEETERQVGEIYKILIRESRGNS